VAHHHDGYWRDLGQPHHYLRAHHEILTDDVDVLSVPHWPVLSRLPQRVPARVLEGGEVVDSMLSPGARVHGRVERSVLGPGVVVEEGALVADSVVFTDSVVESGAEVYWAVVDTRSVVAEGARVGAPDGRALDDPDAVTLIGCDSRVGPGAVLGAGARLEPGTVAADGGD
jgi:glucose-1-phosphate adenylyltransferase